MYTKGEWTVIGRPNAYMVQAKIPNKIHNLKLIADCFDNKEDAQLIASAPDLYEACRKMRDVIEELVQSGDVPLDHTNIVEITMASNEGLWALSKAGKNE